jgi:hypothetical protein
MHSSGLNGHHLSNVKFHVTNLSADRPVSQIAKKAEINVLQLARTGRSIQPLSHPEKWHIFNLAHQPQRHRALSAGVTRRRQ